VSKPKAPKLPAPSPQEQALRQAQINLLDISSTALRDSLNEMNLLAPVLFRETGIEPVMGADGKIVGFNRVTDPNASKRTEAERLLLDRSIAAAKGELPSDPVLLKELDRQQQALEDTLRARLGTGFDVSSAGIEALGDFGLNRAIALSDSARKDLVTAEGLSLNRQAGNQQIIDQVIARALGIAGADVQPAAAIGGVAQAYSAPSNQMQQDRMAQYQADMQAWQRRGSGIASALGGVGQLAGLALFAPTSGTMFSRMFGGGAAAGSGSGMSFVNPAALG